VSGRPHLKCDETIFLSIEIPSTRKNTKREIKNGKSKKNRPYTIQKKKDKRTN